MDEMPKARHRALLGTVREETAALHRAIAAGRQEEVQRHLQAGADPDFLQGMQGTALCNAIASNQPAIAQWLIQNGCDVNAKDFDQTPPLILAIKRQFGDLVQVLLSHPRIQPNNCDPVTDQPPLLVAVEQNSLELARLLVECPKYNANLRDGRTLTALHSAVELNLPDMVSLLAETTDLKLLFNHDGMLPMHMAARLGLVGVFDILCPPSSHSPPDQNEPGEPREKMKKNKHTTAFVSEDYVLDTPNMYSGWTSIHFAVAEGRSEMVDYLLKKGANVNLKTSSGATSLLLACSHGDFSTAERLLEAGADPNASGEVSVTMRNRYGVYHMTPLLIAAGSNNLQLAQCLLDHGADIDGGEGARELPLLTALKCRSTAVTCLFLGLPVEADLTSSPKTQEDRCEDSPSSGSTSTSINQAAHVIRSCSDNSSCSWLQEGKDGWSDCCLEEYCPSGTSLSVDQTSAEEDKAGSSFPAEGAVSSRPSQPEQPPSWQAGNGSKKPATLSSATGAEKTSPPSLSTRSSSPTLDNVKVSSRHQSFVSPAEASNSATKARTAEGRLLTPSPELGKISTGQDGGGASDAIAKGAVFPEVNITIKSDRSEGVSGKTGSTTRSQVARVDLQYKGETPLHSVAGHINRGGELCRRLVELGCKVDLRNRRGNTALHEAVAYSNLGVVQALLEAGSDIDIADLDGDTVLHLAAREGNVAVGKLLLCAGADPEKEGEGLDPDSRPVRVALDSDNVDFVRLLLDAGCSLARESYLVHLDPETMDTDLDEALLQVDAPAIFYEDLDLLLDLMDIAHEPLSLLTLSLNQVRWCFRRKGVRGFLNIQQLPLPPPLIDKLMYVNL